MTETLTVEESDVVELFFEKGWTDGLPIVPPTPDRVAAMLAAGGVEADEVLGRVPERQRTVTAEQTAINSVMAGCKSDYFPVVLAAVECLLDPRFNANAAVTSTGGAALCVVVSGPLTTELGFSTRHNVLGPGSRANATVGRAVRLVASNVLGAKTGGMDGSSVGHPGKFTLCLAEDEPPEPWPPVRVELGYDLADTTVTLVPTEGPRQVANHLNPDATGILRTFAAAMRSPATFAVGKGGQVVLLFGPEHTTALIDQGWTKQAAREFLAQESRISPAELEAAGVLIETGAQHDMSAGPDGKLPAVPGPDDIMIVTAGGAGAGWSAYLPAWAPKMHSQAVSRRVKVTGEALPDCGPDSCSIQF